MDDCPVFCRLPMDDGHFGCGKNNSKKNTKYQSMFFLFNFLLTFASVAATQEGFSWGFSGQTVNINLLKQ
jgi:hypothetical protein